MNKSILMQLLKNNDLKSIVELAAIYFRRKAGDAAYRPDIYYGKIGIGAPLEFISAPGPAVSIIIPAYNQWDFTYSCLFSILANTDGISYEIIMADDCSADETKNILNHVSGIRLIRNEHNLGFIKSCNNAAKEAKGEYLLFLNNDTNVQKNWLKTLVDLIESDPKIGIVGSKLLYPDGTLQDAGGIIWKDASCWIYGRGGNPEKKQYNVIREVDYITGASLMIRKELWQEIGGFDERYSPAYYEDTDLALEVRKRGYTVVYQPKSIVVHFEGISCGTDDRSGIKHYQRINKNKFFAKWEAVLRLEYQEPGSVRPRSSCP